MRSLLVYLKSLVRRRAAEAELDEELRYHLERDVERRVAAGATLADAHAAARRDFGNVTAVTESAREASRVDLVEHFLQDTRYALRTFRRAPRFALTVVLTIGLGLGLISTAFTLFDAYVLRPLAVRDPHSLYEMTFLDQYGRGRNATWREYQALSRSNPAFDEMFAYQWVFTRRDGEPMMLQVVSTGFFRTLGVNTTLGRALTSADGDDPGSGSAVLVLSHQAWRAKFGSDSSVVGRRILVRDRSFEIIGVAPDGFDGLTDTPPDFWAPISMFPVLEDRAIGFDTADAPSVKIVGRIKIGTTALGAERALGAWAAAVTVDAPPALRARAVALESRATAVHMSPETMVEVSPIIVAFAMVLLIACANVANMMLARGMARQREFGIRLALGAARGRLVRQLMTEALLLSVPAGVAGFLISRLALDGGISVMFATVPEVFVPYMRVVSFVPDVRVFAFVFGGAVISAIAFGLVPALQTTRTNVVGATRGEFSSTQRPTRLRNALVIAQITICALLLVSAGLMLRTAGRMKALDLGFRVAGVVHVNLTETLRSRVIDRLRVDPSVTTLEAASQAPFDGRFPQVALTGSPAAPTVSSGATRVTPGYFGALGIRVLRGRSFTTDEARAKEPVALVSESTARLLWPGTEAIGATVRLAPIAARADWEPRTARVIGVVSDAVVGFVGEAKQHPVVYEPAMVDLPGATLIVATHERASLAKRSVQQSLAGVDPSGSSEIHTLEEAVALQVYPFRAAHWVASGLGVVALLLTITGIYGVLAYVVALREKEIGIRVALGATRRIVVGMVVGESVRLAIIGVALGAVAALGASRVIAARLPVIASFDSAALIGGVGVVFLAALAAAYVPSRRAAAVDPVETLKS